MVDGFLSSYQCSSCAALPGAQHINTVPLLGPLAHPHLLLQGFISQASLEKAAVLRQQGAAFVIVSGARTSTVLQRLPYLPAADAIVAENGEGADQLTSQAWGAAVCASCHWHS